MTSALIGFAVDTAFFGWLIGKNQSPARDVKDKRILRLFEEMKFRMGMEDANIRLRQSKEIVDIRATGLICFGMTGQIIQRPGLFDRYTDAEISAVLAHELSHLKHYDTIRTPLFYFTAQVVSSLALSLLFSLPPFACGFIVGGGITMLFFSPYIELQAEEEAAKVLDNVELLSYIRYHGDGDGDFSDWSHPSSNRVVALLQKELDSRFAGAIAAAGRTLS